MKALFKNKLEELFEVDEGAVLTFCKNESLDSGIIKISNITTQLKRIIEPFDEVILSDFQLNTKILLVDDISETITCLNPLIYSYEIKLFSKTKDLENYLLPTLKITRNPKDNSQTIYNYLNRYNILFGPKIRIVSGNTYTWENKYIFSDTVINKFSDIICPEMQWNKPTLREVLNDLMMVKDCIPIVTEDNKIDLFDLSAVNDNGDISTDANINYITSSKSSEDYVSELKVNLMNVTNPKNDKVLNYVTRMEYFPISAEENIINTDNWFVKTQYPIYKLKSLKMAFIATYHLGEDDHTDRREWHEIDLTKVKLFSENLTEPVTRNLIYEYQQWMTLKTRYTQVVAGNVIDVNEWDQYTNYTLYYKRGDNKIFNFTNKPEKYFILQDAQLYLHIESAAMLAYMYGIGYTNPHDYSIGLGEGKYYTTFFAVEYETLEECVFKASKGDIPTHTREIADNQTNSYIDSYNQGFLEYQKANRLGNLQLYINARYTSYDNIIEIGDYYRENIYEENKIIDSEDSIVYQCQYQFYKNHVEVNALATKDYVLRNYFTGVKAKIRSWKIVDGNEAFVRHDLNKYYLEFSFKKKTEKAGLSIYKQYGSNVDALCSGFLSSIRSNSTTKPLKYAILRTVWMGVTRPDTGYYSVDLISRIVGNSIVFTFGFPDNYYVDKCFDTEINNAGNISDIGNINLIDGGIPTQYCRYVGPDGTMDVLEYYFYTTITTEFPPIAPTNAQQITFATTIFKKPLTNWSECDGVKYYDEVLFLKDNAEITYLSTQFELCSDTRDICFTKEMLERNIYVRNVDIYTNYSLRISNQYNFRKPEELPSDAMMNTSLYFTTSSDSKNHAIISIGTNFWYTTEDEAIEDLKSMIYNKAIYIVDGLSNVMMAINVRQKELYATYSSSGYKAYLNIHLNLLKDRHTEIYDTQADQNIIGHLE